MELQELLSYFPQTAKFVSVKDKNPGILGHGWQKKAVIRDEAIAHLESNPKANGLGCMCGPGGVVFIDHDGASVDELIEEITGLPITQALPPTLTISSGTPGHYQKVYYCSVVGSIKSRQRKTGVKTYNETKGKEEDEQLDIRCSSGQSVIWGDHPSGTKYEIVDDSQIAPCPDWIIQFALKEKPTERRETAPLLRQSNGPDVNFPQTDLDWANLYLPYIDPSPMDWYQWRDATMALHSVGFSEDEARSWSAQSTKHTDKGFGDVWKYIKGNPGPGIAWLGARAKEGGWESPFKGSGELPTRSPSTLKPKVVPIHKGDAESIGEFLDRLTASNLPESEEAIEVTSFASQQRLSTPDLYRSLEARRRELEREETREWDFRDIQDLLSTERLNLKKILPNDLAERLITRGESFGQDPALLLLPLLSAVSSLSNPNKRLFVKRGMRIPPPIWSALIGPSGAIKSPLLDCIFKTLATLQLLSSQEFKKNVALYEAELAEWKREKNSDEPPPAEPRMRSYYLTEGTWEGKLDVLNYQKNGILCHYDELQALMDSLSKQGRHGDATAIFNCNQISKALKGTSYKDRNLTIDNPLMPFSGTTQMDNFSKYLRDSNDDASGFWARFLVGYVPEVDSDLFADGGDLEDYLLPLFEKIAALELQEKSPTDIRLSPEAAALYHDFDEWWKAEKKKTPVFGKIFNKLRGYAGRVALALQTIEDASYNRASPSEVIGERVMAGAIAVMKFHVRNTRYIYSSAGVGDIDPSLLKILETSKSSKASDGWVTVGEINRARGRVGRQKGASEIVRKGVTRLVEMGLGEKRIESRSISFRAFLESSENITEKSENITEYHQKLTKISPPQIGCNPVSDIDLDVKKTENITNITPTEHFSSAPEVLSNVTEEQKNNAPPPPDPCSFEVLEKTEKQPQTETEGSDGMCDSGDILVSFGDILGNPGDILEHVGDSQPDLNGDRVRIPSDPPGEACPELDIETAKIFVASFLKCSCREELEQAKEVLRESFGLPGQNKVAGMLTDGERQGLLNLPTQPEPDQPIQPTAKPKIAPTEQPQNQEPGTGTESGTEHDPDVPAAADKWRSPSPGELKPETRVKIDKIRSGLHNKIGKYTGTRDDLYDRARKRNKERFGVIIDDREWFFEKKDLLIYDPNYSPITIEAEATWVGQDDDGGDDDSEFLEAPDE